MRTIPTVEAAQTVAPVLAELNALKQELADLKAKVKSCENIHPNGFTVYAEETGLDIEMGSADGKYGPIDFFLDNETKAADQAFDAGWQTCAEQVSQLLGIRVGIPSYDPFEETPCQ